MKKEPVLIKRYLEKDLGNLVRNQYSCLLLGPRQTGKTTLTEKVLALAKNKKKILFTGSRS
jgi:predicted AAA+ superfamily ATPase